MSRRTLGAWGHVRGLGAWLVVAAWAALALYPWVSSLSARHQRAAELDRVEAALRARGAYQPLDPAVSLRVQRLSPLLASWETVGGCGAGSSGGTGTVKWIGRNTTGGLFQDITQLSYTHLDNAFNLGLSTQISRDLDDRWNVGVLVPLLYKRYNDYKGLPVDISNSGFGDINLLGTLKLGEIRATSLSASIGLPTGPHDGRYKMDLLTQEKQLGLGEVTGSLTLDHTVDEDWGLLVFGGLASWRGGENELGSYRAPMASAYGYAGYFVGPWVPAFGLSLTGFPVPDRDRGIEQDVPLLLVAPNLSLEWSTDWIAVLAGFSLPIGLYAKPTTETGGLKQASPTGIQPWTAALGVSISPF